MIAQWRSGTRYLVGVGLVLVVGYLVYLSRPILPELVVAALVAFLVGFVRGALGVWDEVKAKL